VDGVGSPSSSTEVAALTAQLVAIDSANPSLVPGGAGEAAVAHAVARWATAHGLRVEVLEPTPGRPNVVVRGGNATGGRTLLLCGHLDTVGHAGVHEALTPRVADGRLHGRGAYDMKGGLAAALIACRDAAAAGIAGQVVVAAVADEEHASTGIQQVLPGLRADGAIVTEPTELAVATAHKGFAWVEIDVLGKAAHGSRPALGVDAIRKAGPVLLALDRWDARLREGQRHPLLGPANVHASLISGGNELSTIPDRCTLSLERRTLPGETGHDVQREVDDLLHACRQADPELEAHGRVTLVRDAFQTPLDASILHTIKQAADGVLGTTRVEGMSYWADSAFISAAGIPTVLFGPAGDGAHADLEWVDLTSLDQCTRVLTATALAFCR